MLELSVLVKIKWYRLIGEEALRERKTHEESTNNESFNTPTNMQYTCYLLFPIDRRDQREHVKTLGRSRSSVDTNSSAYVLVLWYHE